MKQSGKSPAADDISRMVAPCLCFQKSVFAVFRVQVKRTVHEYQSGNHTKGDTRPLVDACHIQHGEHNEQTEQPACEYEQVLTFQPFELRRFAYSPVDWILCHLTKRMNEEW